jgi:hypothetical protein
VPSWKPHSLWGFFFQGDYQPLPQKGRHSRLSPVGLHLIGIKPFIDLPQIVVNRAEVPLELGFDNLPRRAALLGRS